MISLQHCRFFNAYLSYLQKIDKLSRGAQSIEEVTNFFFFETVLFLQNLEVQRFFH